MPERLISADKLLKWLKREEQYYADPGTADRMYCEGREMAYHAVEKQIVSGTFDPTPVQTDTPKQGDRVLHGIDGLGTIVSEKIVHDPTCIVDFDKLPFPKITVLSELEVIAND